MSVMYVLRKIGVSELHIPSKRNRVDSNDKLDPENGLRHHCVLDLQTNDTPLLQ